MNRIIHINDDDLLTFAENAGRGMKPVESRRGSVYSRTLTAQLREIRRLRDEIEREGDVKDTAREWLLDNYYIARREGVSAARELRGAGKLRSMPDGRLLLSELASSLVRSGKGAVDKKRCEVFLTGFQKSRPLSLKELALFPAALRAALVGELLELCREAQRPVPETAEGFERVFTSLRLLGTLDLSDMLERVDRTEQILRCDPAGVYPHMDEKTRAEYRARVAVLAKRMGTMEYRVARQAVKLAERGRDRTRHVGYYLFIRPLGGENKTASGTAYIAGNVLLTLFFTLLIGFLTGSASAALLVMIPMSELVKNLLDAVFLRAVKPRHIPRMELRGGVPEAGKTLCVVVSLLTGEEDGSTLARRIEEYRLANRDAGGNLAFGLLVDLPEGKDGELPGAKEWLAAAAEQVEKLNRKYGGGFYLLARGRVFSKRDGTYMGWERKRGALTELMQLLRGQKSGVKILAGEPEGLKNTRFVLTLDSDTRLGPGTARELIGAMLHPLVRPVIDVKRRAVVSGHGVIQPRMSTELASAGRTDFSRIYAGQGGTDPYGGASGEIYMDSFGRGGFAGKGIIDVDAFMLCMDGRVPENTVLSHDTLEGAYLRGGYMGDVELTDGFPSGVRSYFRRLERWTRGDWQNLPWLYKGGLHEIERWRIFDSLRRSLFAPISLAALLTYFIFPGTAMLCAAVVTALALASPLLLSIAEGLVKRQGSAGVRYHSFIVHGAGGMLIRTLLKLLLLPYEAWICASAAATALWRMLVSHKRLLAWQTAAQTDRAKNTVGGSYTAMWPCIAAGLGAVIFSGAIIGMAAGIAWIFTPLFAAVLSREKEKSTEPSEEERAYLLNCAREMWGYFEEFCTEDNNYLPPDNFQESPPVGLARRTSPTNIGMGLLSILSAEKLGLISREKAETLLENITSTLERMEKWNGHLLNWYDTRDLKPLRPAYVSTVDSGNLAGCLIALREALLKWGREDLAERINAMLAPMDFAILYDDTRRLFRIGVDVETEKPTEGWYDLMSSEARLSGYIAIARGDVDRRHWRRLGRSQVQKDGYRGMVSWTGTMFEYLMPELIMPIYRDSLLYESARFCVYVQKRRTAGSGRPWGISESAFFSLDPSLDYRYKAHGCAALALKRGQDSELVVSPYSTFLTLAVHPNGAVKNLKRLEELGARGRFGFWEAVDFTPSRCPDKNGAVVRCVMAHHVGMSMCAVADYLEAGYLQKLFMSDPAMAAHAGLLQERVPLGGILLDSREKDVPEKPHPGHGAAWAEGGTGVDFQRPKIALLSNGTYRILATEAGAVITHAGELMPYRNPRRLPGDGAGVDFFLRGDGGRTPLLPVSEPDSARNAAWELSTRRTSVSTVRSGIRALVETMVCAGAHGELRRVTLSPVEGDKPECRLELCLEPVMARERDYLNHPAFYRLGLEKKRDGNLLLIRRLARGRAPERWMCIDCDRKMEVSEAPNGEITVSAGIYLREGLDSVTSFAIALGDTEQEAKKAAEKTLGMPDDNAADLTSACAALLGMDCAETSAAMDSLAGITLPRASKIEAAAASQEGRHGLWRFGVSGDLPIVCAYMNTPDELPGAETLLRRHTLLAACGVDYDLVFLTIDGGDYRRPCTTALWGVLRSLDREGAVGERGGVHFADSTTDVAALIQSASVVMDLSMPEEEYERNVGAEYIIAQSLPDTRTAVPEYTRAKDGGVVFRTGKGLPKRTWTNMLTNGRFGYLATDCGTGHMWYMNAREYRVGRWVNDPWATVGTETLEIITSNERRSLFADPRDRECEITFSFGAAQWVKTVGGASVKTTAFVPPDIDARIFIIESENASGAQLAWQTELVLSGDDRDAVQVDTSYSGGALTAKNPRGAYPNDGITALSDIEPLRFTCDRASWIRGEPGGEFGAGYDPCLAAVYPMRDIQVLVCGTGDPETLKRLASPENALRALEETKKHWHDACMQITVKTPDNVLNSFLNGWGVYQALACRVMGRTSIYQSGGAYGYRDQLQDAVNLLAYAPGLTREQILSACAHQFEEGDVQHWWHPVDGPEKGVRTRCSDDLLWLPWAVCEYVEKTGDRTVLAEKTPYLSSPVLGGSERERYEMPAVSNHTGTVLEHAGRAIDMALRRGTGENGLLLAGTGDWNDGMDKIGEGGKGESVWLTWFFAHTARRFAGLMGERRYAGDAERLGRAANSAWDGGWYLRGFFDDGAPLGSKETKGGCLIDSIAQSFSTLCVESDPERRRTALKNALEHLFDKEKKIVKLFTPPFSDAPRDPGYIQSYGMGFRENGGQYTHGAIWLAMACLKEGMVQEGYEILSALLPENHDLSVYQAEPYVIAADVYAAEGREGEAGWSWYTGSAGWFLRVALEELLGLRQKGGELLIEPRLPEGWGGFSASWRGREIVVTREGITVDGVPYEAKKEFG